jgi:S1-C subfamily serine protease
MAAEDSSNPLAALSAALAALVAAATPRVVGIRAKGSPPLTGMLWRPDVVVASEQVFPDVGEAEIQHSDGALSQARVAGRDPGTNVVALRLDTPVEIAPPALAEPVHGGLALVLSAGSGGPRARLGLVSRLGPAWVSRAGGQIDHYIGLDLMIGARGEGGPVVDAAGGLLGMTTTGPDRYGLVIPTVTIDRVIGPLLATGRIARG